MRIRDWSSDVCSSDLQLRKGLNMKLKVGLVAALLLGGTATAVYAADRLEPTRVSALLKTRLPKTQVSQIDCDKVAGLCEVVAGKTLFYVDGTARYLIVDRKSTRLNSRH